MYAGAFCGFRRQKTGNLWLGVLFALVGAAGALMGLLTVTIGVNQHVAGIGTTLALVAASDYTSRLLYSTGSRPLAEVLACSAGCGCSGSTRRRTWRCW